MEKTKDSGSVKAAIWLSRFLRWGFGLLFIWAGTLDPSAWPAYILGGITFITGFFRPKRCLEETCDVPNK